MVNTISSTELKALIDSGKDHYLVEALPQRYFLDGHIPGAINIPHDEIKDQAHHKLPDKDITVVVYCANTACQNSKIAAEWLAGHGYKNVFEFVGGKQEWVDTGFTLVRNNIAA